MTWEEFRQEFEAEYRTEDQIHEKVQEFISLQQGSSAVKEYSVKFNSLARFAPGIVSTLALRRDKFVHGLKPEIAWDIMTSSNPPRNYSEALRRAMKAEIFENKISPVGSSTRGPSDPPSAPQREKQEGVKGKEMKNQKKKFQYRQNRREWKNKRPRTEGFPLCPQCMRNHLGECLKDQRVCYRCRQLGHMMRDCKAPLPPPA